MRLLALLPLFLGIAGSPANSIAAALSKSDLIGNWEDDPGTCEGDNFVLYQPDGRFFGYDFEGRWTLSGDILTTSVTKRMGSDEKWRRVKPSERDARTIVSFSPERMIVRGADGSLLSLHRCR